MYYRLFFTVDRSPLKASQTPDLIQLKIIYGQVEEVSRVFAVLLQLWLGCVSLAG